MTWEQVAMWAVLMGWGALCVSFAGAGIVSEMKKKGKDSDA